MKKIAINFSDANFSKIRRLNTITAKWFGGVDEVKEFSPEDIDPEFYDANKVILKQNRGGGYWLWKPYFIKRALESCELGDYLFYCDSGAIYINSIDHLISVMKSNNDDLMLFEVPLIERQWTNSHLIKSMSMQESSLLNENQIVSGYILIKKTKKTVAFIDDYLELCKKEEFITDIMTEEDEEAFDHRHDQSILSLLAKKRGIKPYKDPSDYGAFPLRYLSVSRLFKINGYKDNYPVIVLSNRKAHPVIYWVKFKVRIILKKVFGYGV